MFLSSLGETAAAATRLLMRDTGPWHRAERPGLLPGGSGPRAEHANWLACSGPGFPAGAHNAAQVAREGFEALMAGKDHVVAGSAKNKVQAAAGRLLPETAKAKVQASQTEPGSGGDPASGGGTA
jgi:uncharacterized protein